MFYEKDPITFRLAANYVSKDLYSLGGTKATDVYVQQRFRLDLGTAYQVTKNIQLYFDAHNLTDQTLKYTETASTSPADPKGILWHRRHGRHSCHLLGQCAAKLALGIIRMPCARARQWRARPPMPHYDHIFVIVEENQGLADILNKPFTPNLTSLAKQYGLATQYYGVVHPSEGNYVAMLGGDTFGIHDDDAYFCKPNSTEPVCKRSRAPDYVDHTIHQPNLADQLTAQGLTWKAY